ncbi:hypothetical protein I7I48_09923 [Histoplasma ohiense]|nr:hypothetical protein I7I48_09923 [Histoplasma ohiense (nom. inval.)]
MSSSQDSTLVRLPKEAAFMRFVSRFSSTSSKSPSFLAAFAWRSIWREEASMTISPFTILIFGPPRSPASSRPGSSPLVCRSVEPAFGGLFPFLIRSSRSFCFFASSVRSMLCSSISRFDFFPVRRSRQRSDIFTTVGAISMDSAFSGVGCRLLRERGLVSAAAAMTFSAICSADCFRCAGGLATLLATVFVVGVTSS